MEESLLSVRPTLVRRVSDLFKDGNNNGSQLLFNNTSMQKLRHCCQNLGLFPYLFHSFSNSKSNDAHKLNLNLLINRLCEKIFALYTSNLRHTIRSHLTTVETCQKSTVSQESSSSSSLTVTEDVKQTTPKVDKFAKEIAVKSATRRHNVLLTVAVYLVPVVLLSQLLGLMSLVFIGKHTPGFIFLLSALVVLAGVSMKIFLFQNSTTCVKNHGKRKSD